MKRLLSIISLLFINAASAADSTAPSIVATVTGEVLEARDAGSYTYLRLGNQSGEIWAAVGRAQVSPGEQVRIEGAAVMADFESKALKRTFERIVFGVLARGVPAANDLGVATASKSGDVAPATMSVGGHAGGEFRVEKASGPAAYTVAEIITQREAIKDQTVVVRGRVVKVNEAVMGRNWIHLRDGSGSATDKSNDLLVTSAEPARFGDVMTIKGIVRTNKDFGAGYAYQVLVEDATVQ